MKIRCCVVASPLRLIPAYSFVNLLMLDEMGFLSEGLAADLASKRFFPGVRSQMHLDIALVEKASITYRAPVHRFLFAPNQGPGVRAVGYGRRGGICRRAVVLLRRMMMILLRTRPRSFARVLGGHERRVQLVVRTTGSGHSSWRTHRRIGTRGGRCLPTGSLL